MIFLEALRSHTFMQYALLAGLLVIDGVFLYVYLFAGLMWLLALLLFSGLLHYRRCHNKVESLKEFSA